MTPHEFLGVLDDAIAVAERQRMRRRAPILALTGSPTLPQLGETGAPDPDQPGVYWFSLQQCRDMRDRLLAAARDDAGVPEASR
jgi:hypothetical protein